jgi:ATP-dependent protease ClpP protease subunit
MTRTALQLDRPARGRPEAKSRPEQASWYRIENHAAATSVYIYDEIGMWGVSAADFVVALAEVAGAFDLHINSPGGDVFDGVAIYNAILGHSGEVTGYIDGLAASAASFIAMACDTVKIAKTGQMMIHDASGLAWGNAADMSAMASLLDKASDNIAGIYADKSGRPAAEWRDAMRAETWYSADEAVAAGLADEVFTPVKTRKDAAAENAWDLSIFNYAGRDNAPAPQTPPAAAPEVAPVDEPAFAWDSAQVLSALRALRTPSKEAVQ